MASKHLPPELIAHLVSFLQTADTHDVCFGGRTSHLDRLRRRADSLCRDRAALAVVCREWRGILSQKAFKAATWTRALFGVEQTHGAERDFALRRRAVQRRGRHHGPGPRDIDNYSFPYALVRPGTSWPLFLDVVDVMIPIEMARAARDGDRAALDPLCGVLDRLRSTFPNADIYTTPESIIACLSGGPDPQWIEAPVPYRVVSWLTDVEYEGCRGKGDFQTLTDATFTLQAPVYQYVGQGHAGAVFPHGPCWLCQATVNTVAGVDLNSLTTHGDATVTLQFADTTSDHPSACYLQFHFNEIEICVRAQIAPFQQLRMEGGEYVHDICGCGKCAEEETEFCGLVDLVEKRFFEAGLREPELEEACDPAWKVVDESGYAEGVRYLRATYDVPRGRRDPAQPKICSFFPHKDGRARCWGCGSKHK